MARVKGLKQFRKWERGEILSRKESMTAQCYQCNGFDEGGIDCNCPSCPLYQFMPYRRQPIMPQAKI